MNKSFLIFKHEFLHKIKSAGFLILTLSVPIAVLLGIGVFKLAKNLFEEPGEVVERRQRVNGREIVDIVAHRRNHRVELDHDRGPFG